MLATHIQLLSLDIQMLANMGTIVCLIQTIKGVHNQRLAITLLVKETE
jgi:hypothetical protein